MQGVFFVPVISDGYLFIQCKPDSLDVMSIRGQQIKSHPGKTRMAFYLLVNLCLLNKFKSACNITCLVTNRS